MSQPFSCGVGNDSAALRQEGCYGRRMGPWSFCFVLLQRFLFLRLKVSRLDNIFLTRMHWSNVGGLCGEYILSQVRGWGEVSGILTCLALFLPDFGIQGLWNTFYAGPVSCSRENQKLTQKSRF